MKCLIFLEAMPFNCGGMCVPLAVAFGAVAVSGAAFYYLQYKRKSKPLTELSAEVPKTIKSGGFLTKETLLKKLIPRENKMVFVVNRPLLMNKQNLFLTVSTACLRCYEMASKQKSCQASMKAWVRSGQMKVVVKGQNNQQLMEVSQKASELNLPCVLLKANDVKCLGANDARADDFLIACIIGPVNHVDTITGHLKLL